MAEKFNQWSFSLCLLCSVLSFHSLYTAMNQTWSIAPPLLILWSLSILAFVLGITGFSAKRNGLSKIRSWSTVIVSFFLSIFLLLGVAVNIFAREPIETTHSPNGDYTINFYTENGGAASSINVVGIIDGPLWFKKNIYDDMNMHKADVKWINNHTISINEHVLDLNKKETFSD